MEEADDGGCFVCFLSARSAAEDKGFFKVFLENGSLRHKRFYFRDCLGCHHSVILLIMKKVLIPLANGFEDIEAVTIIDVLRRGKVQAVTASLTSGRTVLSAHGIRMEADALLADVIDEEYAAIILPGGGEGTANLMADKELAQRLRRQKEDGLLVCAICAAPTVLDAAGVLNGEDVTCYPSCAAEMSCRVKHIPVIADGQIITGQGPGTATLFALVVLAHVAGEDRAQNVANGMLAEFE